MAEVTLRLVDAGDEVRVTVEFTPAPVSDSQATPAQRVGADLVNRLTSRFAAALVDGRDLPEDADDDDAG